MLASRVSRSGFHVLGLGFSRCGVSGSGFSRSGVSGFSVSMSWVSGFELAVYGIALVVRDFQGFAFRVRGFCGSSFRGPGFGFGFRVSVSGFWFGVERFGVSGSCLALRVAGSVFSGSGFRVWWIKVFVVSS